MVILNFRIILPYLWGSQDLPFLWGEYGEVHPISISSRAVIFQTKENLHMKVYRNLVRGLMWGARPRCGCC